MLFPEESKAIIEALLFVSTEPLSIEQITKITDIPAEEVQELIYNLQKKYAQEGHGFYIIEVANGFQFTTKSEYFSFVEKLYKPRLSSLSHAALETLAIIAYKQPITRSEIEAIRGVKVDKTINTLAEKKLVEEKGRKDSPGKPILFGTTNEFLQYFGLKDLSQLPSIEELLIKTT